MKGTPMARMTWEARARGQSPCPPSMLSPMAFPCARRAEDVAPYHVCAAGPTSKIRSDLILEVFRKLTAKHPVMRQISLEHCDRICYIVSNH